MHKGQKISGRLELKYKHPHIPNFKNRKRKAGTLNHLRYMPL
jgi:hypothetical protein